VWGLPRYWEVHRKEVGTNTEARGQKKEKKRLLGCSLYPLLLLELPTRELT